LASTLKKHESWFKVKQVDHPTYEYDAETIQRYDPKDDPRKIPVPLEEMTERDKEYHLSKTGKRGYVGVQNSKLRLHNMKNKVPGYRGEDYALAEAAWTVNLLMEKVAYRQRRLRMNDDLTRSGDEWYRNEYTPDPKELTGQVKRAAKFFGAGLVGIAKVNPLWIYKTWKRDGKPVTLPEGVDNVVVMAIEMDEDGIAATPALANTAACGLGYLRVAISASLMAEFIRNLGFQAIPAGNDVGLNIPLAIDAGLGQQGRNGILVTPELGSRIRISKVFTDMPIIPDQPIDFGVNEFCATCKKCAEACEVEAISFEDAPGWDPVCRANNPGARKWYVDSEKCHEYWYDNASECSTCISVCTYTNGKHEITPEEFWMNKDS